MISIIASPNTCTHSPWLSKTQSNIPYHQQ
jgi:hypothetical protein